MIPAANHPLWGIIERGMVVVLVGFLLWYNYSSTDHRDLKTILEVAMALIASGTLRHSLSSPEK